MRRVTMRTNPGMGQIRRPELCCRPDGDNHPQPSSSPVEADGVRCSDALHGIPFHVPKGDVPLPRPPAIIGRRPDVGQEGSVDEILMGLWKMDLARSLVWTIRGVPGSVGGGRWVCSRRE